MGGERETGSHTTDFTGMFHVNMIQKVLGGLWRGEGGRQRSRVRLLAALSLPLAALAHLHFRQLDVAQHVGV